MRSFARQSQGMLATAFVVAAGLGLTACGNYAIFAVHISSATPRDDIEACQMDIVDENGAPVVTKYALEKVYGQDSTGALNLKQGCQGGLTNANVGTFSYSTSRTSGSLTFTVNAFKNDGTIIETASSTANVSTYPPEVGVNLAMSRVPGT